MPDSQSASSDTGAPPPLPPNPQWQGSLLRPIAVLIVIVVVFLFVVSRLVLALPAVAAAAADRVPAGVAATLGELTLRSLDAVTFQATALPAARQAEIVSRFSRLRFPAGATAGSYEIVFRRSESIGANAMALPSGTIVVTDGLVELSGHVDEIVAVLAHEAGHVQHRHGLRLLFQSAVARAGISMLLGDISAVAATASTVLLEAKYSRDLERDADTYAVRLLDENGIPREHFARMLERLEEAARSRGAGASGGPGTSYLSSHPVTQERLESLR
jgi:Zn-dependent protease with chaperone function